MTRDEFDPTFWMCKSAVSAGLEAVGFDELHEAVGYAVAHIFTHVVGGEF